MFFSNLKISLAKGLPQANTRVTKQKDKAEKLAYRQWTFRHFFKFYHIPYNRVDCTKRA